MIASERTHLIVHMQAGFRAAGNPRTIEANQREIVRGYKLSGCTIINLECIGERDDYGHTLPALTELLHGYPGWIRLRHKGDSGREEIVAARLQRVFCTKVFTVGGINTDACVKANVRGLRAAFPECTVEVIEGACNAVWTSRKQVPAIFSGMAGVSVRIDDPQVLRDIASIRVFTWRDFLAQQEAVPPTVAARLDQLQIASPLSSLSPTVLVKFKSWLDSCRRAGLVDDWEDRQLFQALRLAWTTGQARSIKELDSPASCQPTPSSTGQVAIGNHDQQ